MIYSRGMTERVPQRGIHTVLASVQEKDVSENAANTVRRLLTLDGRIPLNQVRQGLTPTENWVVDLLTQRSNLQLRVPAPGDCVVIQERLAPHLSILLPDEITYYQMAKNHFIAGGIPLDNTDRHDLWVRSQEDIAHFRDQAKRVAIDLKAMEKTSELKKTIGKLADVLTHVAPIIIYVGHQIYSTFDQADENLLDRQSSGSHLLSVLLRKPLGLWRTEDQVFVWGTNLLLESGGAYRLEEFNSAQLTPDNLAEFFDRKGVEYAWRFNLELPDSWVKMPLFDKAHFIRDAQKAVSPNYLRYREINGLTLRKDEVYFKPSLDSHTSHLQTDLARKICKVLHIDPVEGGDIESRWKSITTQAIENGNESLPLLLYAITASAAEYTNSDIALSSSFRDVKKPFFDLGKENFYCAAAPSSKFSAINQDQTLANILRMIAARMQFNRWHLIAGNFIPSEIPDKREWLFPPTSPDISIESDSYHAGHIAVGVHHSIRYPSSLKIDGKTLLGAYDIRLMRQEGQNYSPADLETCKQFVDIMGIVLGTILEKGATIGAFDADWYKQIKWKELDKRILYEN